MRQFYRLIFLQREKRQKRPFGPRLTSSAKIGHVGVYFAKMSCKIEDGFTDIFGFRVRYFMLDRSGRWDRPLPRAAYKFLQPKEKMAEAIFYGAAISFLPLF